MDQSTYPDCMVEVGEICTHCAAVLFLCEYVTREKMNSNVKVRPHYATWHSVAKADQHGQ